MTVFQWDVWHPGWSLVEVFRRDDGLLHSAENLAPNSFVYRVGNVESLVRGTRFVSDCGDGSWQMRATV